MLTIQLDEHHWDTWSVELGEFMALERMKCCGYMTHVYGDAGNRQHAPGCSRKVEKRTNRRIWSFIERKLRLGHG